MMTATKSVNSQTYTRWKTTVLLVLSLVTGLLLMLGCDIPDRHDIKFFRKAAVWEVSTPAPTPPDQAPQQHGLAGRLSENAAAKTDWQYWYLHHIDPDQVTGGGVMQSQQIAPQSTGPERVKVTFSERTLVSSSPVETTPSTEQRWQPNPVVVLTANEQTFWHAKDGRLLRAQCRVRRGPLETSKNTEVTEEQVRFQSDHLTSMQNKQISHRGDLGGPLAVYQSLLSNPLARGEIRESTVLLPIQETLANLQIQGRRDALSKRMTDEGLVMDSLHEAVALVSIDPSTHRQWYYWYDDEGVVQATNITGERRFTYRCSEKQYLQLGDVFLKHQYPISIKLTGKPIPEGKIKQLALDIELSPRPAELQDSSDQGSQSSYLRFGPAPRQYIQEPGPLRQRLITAKNPVPAEKLAGRFKTYDSRSSAADVAATKILDFGSPAVRQLLQISASMKGMNDQEKAAELNRTVHSLLSLEPLSVGIRAASEIAQGSVADSTEHAILLIAMLRASSVPARLATGMKYLPGTKNAETTHRFVYHAWVIARTDDSWISLDPTTGKETGADCVALKIDDLSNLDAAHFVDDYLAILRSLKMTVSGVVVQ